jgi:hypothetical protein
MNKKIGLPPNVDGAKKSAYEKIKKQREYDLNMKVWVVIPECHGNGGWCGSTTLSFPEGITLREALEIDNPYKVFNQFDIGWGTLSAIRICTSENPNHTIYIYDHEDYRWERSH